MVLLSLILKLAGNNWGAIIQTMLIGAIGIMIVMGLGFLSILVPNWVRMRRIRKQLKKLV
jgi:integral membrane sensor domain MASE1